jgi:hypothetical protein
MLITLVTATENGHVAPQVGILTGSRKEMLARGPGQDLGACKTPCLEGNRPRLFQIGTRFPFWHRPTRPVISR